MKTSTTPEATKYREKLPLISLYHERQSRMFCGMHAINNLLQLPENERFDRYKMDMIADDMYNREKQLFAEMTGGHKHFLPRIKNTHKSKIFLFSMGNYSFEVVSEALAQKGYAMDIIDVTAPYTEWHVNDPTVIGIIVNVRNMTRNQFNLCNCFPFFKTRLGDGHWFSIGKVYNIYGIDTQQNNPEATDASSSVQIENDYGTADNVTYRWYNHDSKFKTPQVLSSNEELYHFIQNLYEERQLQMWRVSKIL
jgi:hypothetical protein